MTLESVNPLEWVRARPSQFFGRDEADPVGLLAYVMADIVELGQGECAIRSADGWWIIGSNVDWLNLADRDVSDLFRRVVPAPQHGEHSMRAEILVAAFARDIAVVGADGLLQVQGETPSPAVTGQANDLKRAVIFRL